MIGRLRAAPLGVQVGLLLTAQPFVVASLGIPLVPRAVDWSLPDAPAGVTADVSTAVTVMLLALVGCGIVTAVGAAIVLRGSLLGLIGRMQEATDAIASGRFEHRVASDRSDELGTLAGSIDAMAARLEHLEAGRRRLLANVSHELRTPLTIIQGYAFTLGRSETDARRRERLDQIEREVERLDGFVTELLDTARLQAGGVDLDRRSGDLALIVADAADRFRDVAQRRGLRIVVEGAERELGIHADQERIHQVFANLLSNAVAHAPGGSEVVVGVEQARRGRLRAWVRNDGAPLAPEVAATIFDPFVQGPRRTGRAGLGLAIARELVRAHGGELDYRAADGHIIFTVELPEAAAPAEGLGPEALAHGAHAERAAAPTRPVVVTAPAAGCAG